MKIIIDRDIEKLMKVRQTLAYLARRRDLHSSSPGLALELLNEVLTDLEKLPAPVPPATFAFRDASGALWR